MPWNFHGIFYYSKLFKTLETSDVLTENIKLDVHNCSHFDIAEVGVLSGIRDDGDSKGVVGRLAYGERNTIHGYAAFIDGKIALASHLLVELKLEGEVG